MKLLELAVPDTLCERLLTFLALLVRWNQTYNLTAIKDPLEMVDRHLIDSLSILGHVQGKQILDVGTGPGFPGIPLAMAMPERRFLLLDSNLKKIRFVRQAVLELGLENVEPVLARVEEYHPDMPIDCLISRALASLPKLLSLTESIRVANTRVLAMKGTVPRDEIEALAVDYEIETHTLRVPSSLGERHLIMISQRD
ncbi:MAG: 16S rRNA (guanine(527)-N(7))-methyltransferase RsmG [Gammaproteobacteria bacterium]|nr:16S rRNA (guanine(527)-N(7))-methyltransferase RsmG [Gammaproteobacteria bacterium]